MALVLLLIHFGLVLLVVGGMIVLSYVLGERHSEKVTGEPYESGMKITGSARTPYRPHFYLVALFFVIFDLEAVFLFSWAIAAAEAGWSGYIEVVVFAGVLLAALVYLWRLGALDWGSTSRRSPPSRHPTSPKEHSP